MMLPMEASRVIHPARNIAGALQLPGDKSISHRYAMLAALAAGTTRLDNFSTGADCASTLECLRTLGVEWKREGGSVEIRGRNMQLAPPATVLNCGNSGSTMRMLSGILAGQDFSSELTGDESLSRRPMARVIAPMELMGAKIESSAGNRPPLRIRGGHLRGIGYEMPIASAQVKTCLLFAGLFAEGSTTVVGATRTRDHGELALRAFGAAVVSEANAISIAGGQSLQAIEAAVPGDISTAAFFLCAAALFPESQLTISGLLLNPTRAKLLDLLTSMGLKIAVTQIEEHHGELTGTLEVRGGILRGAVVEGATSAALIDEIPVLAAIAPYTEGGLEVRDARELRVKESDRIAAIAANLRAMGAEIEEREDGFRIPGKQALQGAEVDSMGDHRIAMAFAIAGLRANGDTLIRSANAAAISYPAFFETMATVAVR